MRLRGLSGAARPAIVRLFLGRSPATIAMRITSAGKDALGTFQPMPTGPDLLNYWRQELGKCEGYILQQLAFIYPKSMTKEELALITGYQPNGGGFNNALGKLRTLELISGRGDLKASEVFFE